MVGGKSVGVMKVEATNQGKGHIVRAPQGSGVDSGKDTAQHEGHSGVQRARGVAAADGYVCPPRTSGRHETPRM